MNPAQVPTAAASPDDGPHDRAQEDAIAVVLRQEGLADHRPLGLDSVWRTSGLREAVEREPYA